MRRKPTNGVGAVVSSMAARCLVIALNAATGIITARALGPEGRGELSAMILWPVLLANAVTLGIPSALTYNIRQKRETASGFVGTALLLSVLTTSLAASVVCLFLPAILHQYSPITILYARLFLINAPIGILLQVSRAALEARGDFSASTKSQWLVPAFNLAGLVALWLTHTFRPEIAAPVYVFCSTPVVFWVIRKLWQNYHPRIQEFRKTAKHLLGYGIRSFGIDLCGTLSLYVDQALVVGMLSARSMGIYVVALSLSRMLNFCQASVVMVLFPSAVGRSSAEVVDLSGRAARVSTIFTGAIGLGVAIFGPAVLHALYGRAYVAATSVLRILILEVVVGGAVTVLAQAPMALGRPGVVTALQSLGLAFTVPLMLFLVPRYGLTGAALALLVSTTCRMIFMVVSFSWFLGSKCPSLWVSRSDFEFMLIKAGDYIPALSKIPIVRASFPKAA